MDFKASNSNYVHIDIHIESSLFRCPVRIQFKKINFLNNILAKSPKLNGLCFNDYIAINSGLLNS